MARYKEKGTWTDGNGRRVDSATVSVYLAGTTTAASVYAASSGGSPVNSVTTNSSGYYEFWVDDTDYNQDQLFKIIFTKTAFNSTTIDDIIIFPKNRMILAADQNFYIDSRTAPQTGTLGAERHELTAGIAGARAKHIEIKPAGLDDVSGLVVVQDLDSSSASIRVKGLNFNADISGATNAHVNALEVSKVGDVGSGMKIDAVDVRGGVDVIDHHSGATTSADTAFKYDDSGASYTDVTTAFGSAGTDVAIFDEDDDLIYIGDAAQFNTIEVILATVASNPGIKPTFEYSQGSSAWATLAVSDDTNGFRENGTIFYAIPGDWATDTVNAVASKYWVRIKRTTNNLDTVPTEDTIKIQSTTNYTWDASGNVTINALTTNGIATVNSLQIDDTTGDHQYIFTVNELAADRNVTLPLLAGNDELVMKDHAVTMTNKTLTTPTIASFANATHDHSDAAGGGVLAKQSGDMVQMVNTQTGAVNTGTTVMPFDNTIPQNTEGDEYMTLAITPTSATNKLLIEVEAFVGSTASQRMSVALFQDSTASALAATSEFHPNVNTMEAVSLRHYMTTGTTSSTTFKVRIGGDGAGTTTFNGVSAGRIFGGVCASSITITEIQV